MVGVLVSSVSSGSGRLADDVECVSVQCLVPADGRVALTPRGIMIDTTSKHQNMGVQLVVGDKEFLEKMARSGHGKKNHNKFDDVIHLPKNVMDSDEDGVYDNNSEDDNDQSVQDVFIEGRDKNKNIDEINKSFRGLHIRDKEKLIAESFRRLNKLVRFLSSGKEDLKARSPFRNKSQSKHNQKPFDRSNPTVSSNFGNGGQMYINSVHSNSQPLISPIGTGGRVYVSTVQRNNPTVSSQFGNGGHVYVNSLYHEQVPLNMKDSEIQDIIQDFLSFFNELSPSEQDQFFLSFAAQEQSGLTSNEKNILSESHTLINSPVMSPNPDLYDSSYETGSPGSTVTPSPGSPYYSPPRHSVSYESDQELDPAIEHNSIKKLPNIIVVPAGKNLYPFNHNQIFTVPPEPQVKPLGEPIPCNRESATERLYKLSTSTNFCIKHFSIQLVCVFMKTKAEKATDRFNDFSKSLISLMRQKVGSKQTEIDNWQLAIYAHIQFLVAAKRMKEYSPALMNDGEGHSLLYTAAMKHHDKPLIARYIAESMKQVGYDLTEVMDEKDNTLLHALAKQGDSHCKVLEELVHATSPDGKPLFSLATTNKKGRTPLHVAVRSHRPHITTSVFLLQEGANPLHQDYIKNTPLHYQVKCVSDQWPRVSDDLALLKKMLNHMVPSSADDTFVLGLLSTDPKIPLDILPIIERELRLKKCEKH